MEDGLPHMEVEEVEVAMMIHHLHTTMGLLQGKQHGAATRQHEAVGQGKSNGGRASGLGPLAELRLAIWLDKGINHASPRLNREVVDCSVVELEMQEAAAGLEVVAAMAERAARGRLVLLHQLCLQVDIRAQVSDPRLEGRPEDFLELWLCVGIAGVMAGEQ